MSELSLEKTEGGGGGGGGESRCWKIWRHRRGSSLNTDLGNGKMSQCIWNGLLRESVLAGSSISLQTSGEQQLSLLCSQLQLWQLLCPLCAFLMIQLTQWAYAVFCIINFNYLRWNVIWGCASEWVEVSKCVLERKSPESVCNECLKKKTSAVPWRRLKRSAMSRSSFETRLLDWAFSFSLGSNKTTNWNRQTSCLYLLDTH